MSMTISDRQFFKQNQYTWWQKSIALIAILNLLLVFFNLSYLPLRNLYWEYTPFLVKLYDPVKGVEPHPDTEAYLATVERVRQVISQEGLQSADATSLLASLREQSIALIEENPFLAANKLSTFAKLKHRMEYHMETRSAKQAFTRFWSQEYFTDTEPNRAIAFFADKIQPLFETNYYRRIDVNGLYVDNFWRIDLVFIIFWALEYFSRTLWVAKNREDLNWWDSMLRCWYDLLMLIPVWRWLRIIPVTVRIHKSGLLNLERILAQITHEPAAYLSHRASIFLIVRLLNQSQEIINSGAAAKFLLESSSGVTVGEADKINLIVDRLIGLTIYNVLPQIQPDIEELLRHSLKGALKTSDVYQTVKAIPGLDNLPQEVTEQLADYLAQAAYDVLINSYTDAEGKIIFDRLSDNFAISLRQQLQNQATQTEIQALLSDLIEEWKLNYVKGSDRRDPEATLAEAEKIREEVIN